MASLTALPKEPNYMRSGIRDRQAKKQRLETAIARPRTQILN
ncbi:MAG: hypothetical protein WBM44_27505 [Waterburya sp.]